VPAPPLSRPPAVPLVIGAFAVIYVVWGSTFLAVRFAVESIPPFLTAAARNLVAGGVLVSLGLAGGAARPSARALRQAFVVGGLMFLVNQGGMAWASQRNPSGITALLAATVPLWIVALDWLAGRGRRPTVRTGAGMALGFAGSALLLWPTTGGPTVDIAAAAVTACAAVAWAAGTLRARGMRLSDSPLVSSGLPMLLGGLALAALSALSGEWSTFEPAGVPPRAALALLYLILLGSLLAFSAYVFLLRVIPAARVATYAYVNPVVALGLGAWLGGELVGTSTLVAAAVSLAGVYLVVSD
jgi:drug/metabolite transporter (DMT)-like permease